jgi:hypothetical protein
MMFRDRMIDTRAGEKIIHGEDGSMADRTLVTVIVTPGRVLPDGSCTVPSRSPVPNTSKRLNSMSRRLLR